MTPAPAFERVYPALREWLTSGRLRPGDRLEPGSLARQLDTSVMPVRDALQRLVGERIAAIGKTDGFILPHISEADLRDLYAWNRRLLVAALSGRGESEIAGRIASSASSSSHADRIASLFASIAHRSTNREHRLAVASASARLHAVRIGEAEILVEVEIETARLESLAEAGQWANLRQAVIAYHRRRLSMAPQILRYLERAVDD